MGGRIHLSSSGDSVMSWPRTATKHPPAPVLHPPTAGTGQRIGRAKTRKLVGQEKDRLVIEGKNGKGNCHCSPTGSCPGSV